MVGRKEKCGLDAHMGGLLQDRERGGGSGASGGGGGGVK